MQVEGVFMNILNLFLPGLVQMGLTTAIRDPKIAKIRQKPIFRGVYLILAANNLVIRTEGG